MTLTEEQLKERLSYIGGSDAAGVLGLSRWTTPLHVWAEKTGQVVPEDISDKLFVKLGNRLEQTVAELFMEETGKKVQRVNETIFHPKYPFLGANIDRRVVGEKSILECKTASAWKAKEWDGEEIPREYIIQVMHYLAVTGAARGYIAVLIGNQDFKWKVIERDEKALADLVKREVNFWNDFVVTKAMPAVMGSDADNLSALFPQATLSEPIELPDTVNAIAESLEGMKQDYRNLESQIKQQENELKALLGTAERGTTGLWNIAWSNVPASEYVVKKAASRRFTCKRKTEEK